MLLYVDTSVWVSALTFEERTDDMQRWLGTQGGGSLGISDWAATEFASALAMKCRMGLLDDRERAKVLEAFALLKAESLDVLRVSRVASTSGSPSGGSTNTRPGCAPRMLCTLRSRRITDACYARSTGRWRWQRRSWGFGRLCFDVEPAAT